MVASACLGVACGSTPVESPKAAEPKRRALTPVERLELLLDKVGGEADVVEAVPAPVKKYLEETLARLPGADRERVATDPAIASARPLLHLVAGGHSPAALVALATTPRGANELVEAASATGTSLGGLVAPVAELTRRAALAVLVEHTSRMSVPDVPTHVYEAADAAARTLGRLDVVIAVARVRLHREDDLRARLHLARCLGESLEIDEAEQLLSQVTASAGAEKLGAEIAEVGGILALAESGIRARADGVDDATRLRGAADLLRLGRPDDALAVLGHLGGAVPALDRAALRARALVGDSSCPGLPRAVETPPLCAAAWAGSAAAREASRLVEDAWAAGGPRDPAAIDAYIGFAHVLGLSHSAEVAPAPGSLVERLGALDEALSGVEAPGPHHRGMQLLARALVAGIRARQGAQVTGLAAADVRSLTESAAALSAGELADPMVQAAVVAVAALLVGEQDVDALLEGLPAEPDPSLAPALASLSALSGLSWGNPAAARDARERLAGVMLGEHSAFERAALILLMAEVDLAIEEDERRLGVVVKVGEQLAVDRAAGSLALRGALDHAGALARGGDLAQARRALRGLDGALAVDSLSWLVQGAVAVFDALAPSGDAPDATRSRAVGDVAGGPASRAAPAEAEADRAAPQTPLERLAALAASDASARGAPSAWVAAWAEALEFQKAEAACGGDRACVRRVSHARKPVDLDTMAGPTAARLLRRGLVPVSATELSLHYDPPVGVEPVVRVQLALLPLPTPPGYADQPSSSSKSSRASSNRAR